MLRSSPAASPTGDVPVPLTRVPVGEHRTIAVVTGPARGDLEREGILPGCVVVVRARTPLGGPLVVELGRTRIALSADVAARIATLPAPAPIGDRAP